MMSARQAAFRAASGPTGASVEVFLTCRDQRPPLDCLRALECAGLTPLSLNVFYRHGTGDDVRACVEALPQEVFPQTACLPLPVGKDWHEAANALALGERRSHSTPYMLFLSSDVKFLPGALPPLLQKLSENRDLAGVNPLLLRPSGDGGPPRVAHLGYVADSRGQLLHLYEGLPAAHPLAGRERRFQLGHAAALLARREDFLAIGGFRPELGALADCDFCIRLRQLRSASFSTEPAALALLENPFDAWETCGLWNSLLQRGKLPPALLAPDYHAKAQDDGLRYTVTAWLAETAGEPDFITAEHPADAAWMAWRHAPSPTSLLQLLARLEPDDCRKAVGLCRELPACLPRSFAWYTALAKQLLQFGIRNKLERLIADVRAWQARAGHFRSKRLKAGMRMLAQAGIYDCSLDNAPSVYDAWMELRENAISAEPLHAERSWPEIAVLMPVWNPEPEFLRAAIESVLSQSYPHWQLCLADDASSRDGTLEILRSYAARDSRIRLCERKENGHISRATNSALAMADAPFAALMDDDDLLAKDALGCVAQHIAKSPGLRFLYTDEDRVDAAGVRRTPLFKPDFDFDLHYTWHLSVYASEVLRRVGGLRPAFDGSQDLDLSLRVTEALSAAEIKHIPRILYHWRIHPGSTTASVGAKPYVIEATRKAWEESAGRRGISAAVCPAGKNNFFKLALPIPKNADCSLILLEEGPLPPSDGLLDALRALSSTIRLEILRQPVFSEAVAEGVADWPADVPVRALPPAAGGIMATLRAAADRAEGNVLLFLSGALLPMEGCRPEQLVAQALRPDVACVGGAIWRHGRLWHAGMYPDVTGLPFPLQRGVSRDLLPSVCFGQLLLARRILGASWRCMAARREAFLPHAATGDDLGALAMTDYSLRAEKNGLISLASPWGQWEILTTGEGMDETEVSSDQKRLFLQRWGNIVRKHGLRNPELRAAPDYGWTPRLD